MHSKASIAQLGIQTEAPAGIAPPPAREILLCEKTFAEFCKSPPSKDIGEAVMLCLVEGDMRLLRIASARARRDGATAAREANALGQMAASLGFFQAASLARQLENACLSGDRTAYHLIGRLSEVFQISGAMLNALLRRGTIAGP